MASLLTHHLSHASESTHLLRCQPTIPSLTSPISSDPSRPGSRRKPQSNMRRTRSLVCTLIAGFVIGGCGSQTVRSQPPRPGGAAYIAAVAYVQHSAAQPDWSTYGLLAATQHDLARLTPKQRETDVALLDAYAQQLAAAHQLPADAPAKLISTIAPSTPGLRHFLAGPGAALQAAFLRSNAFKMTIGRQLGCLTAQSLSGNC